MKVDGRVAQAGATPPVPRSIWVVACASLVGQAVLLVGQGGRLDDEVSILVSVVLGSLVVGYVSAGVVRARTVRVVLAVVVLVLSALVDLVGIFASHDPDGAALAALSLATTAVALAGLERFRRSEWYAWQRTRPPSHHGAPIGSLVMIGVLVGALGGLTGPVEGGVDVRISVAEPSSRA
ncbi:hypothetical protein [Nocardioides euryhalodurans]|uniref:Uncharacterized protein n=1 Tax=Nocardioides euryhalodurans TaxID=2518370 RepID=A0A4V1BDL6_9ACTN|nr:hypothetical protein [Nocardioides euryhalodurans]QBR91552.1 hypothetical protein EXE57_04140 [Nocardioides euryhalodurans]